MAVKLNTNRITTMFICAPDPSVYRFCDSQQELL